MERNLLTNQFQLSAAYVGEALIEFYRELHFQTRLTFDDICRAASKELNSQSDISDNEISDWLLKDRVSTLSLSEIPVFVHPELRDAVALLAEKKLNSIINLIICRLAGMSEGYTGKTLMRWESVHLLCRMAAFIEDSEIDKINDEMFFKRLDGGGDPRNVMWAILGNWSYIRGTRLEQYAISFLKMLLNNFKRLIRPFVWEATDNWTHIDSDIRVLVLSTTAKGSGLNELQPIFNDQNTLTFLAAGVVHYGAIQECSRCGCPASELYIDFMNSFISQLQKQQGKQIIHYTSRNNDGLFESPGDRVTAIEILQKLLDIGLRSGSLDISHPLAALLKSSQQSLVAS